MDLPELIKTCKTEQRAFDYLLNEIQRIKGIHCPSCGSSDYYLMSKKRLRCKICRRDYPPFSGTLLSGLKISVISLLLLIKLFELEISARKASTQLDISYPTTLKAFDLFRRSIAFNLAKDDNLLKGEIEADESYFGGRRKGKRGRGAGHKTIVFGILERGGKVSVCILTNVKAESLIDETVKKVRRGSLVYTDKWCGYDSLMFCGYRHLNIDHQYKFKQGKVYINGIEGFIERKVSLLHQKMEWRYNNREKVLFVDLIHIILGADC